MQPAERSTQRSFIINHFTAITACPSETRTFSTCYDATFYSFITRVYTYVYIVSCVGPKCITTPNFVNIGQNGWDDVAIFYFSKWRPSAILDFQTQETLTADWLWRSQMHHRAKFHQNQSNGCGDMVIVQFFKMATVRHLRYVGHILGRSIKSTWRSLSYDKIWLESIEQFL